MGTRSERKRRRSYDQDEEEEDDDDNNGRNPEGDENEFPHPLPVVDMDVEDVDEEEDSSGLGEGGEMDLPVGKKQHTLRRQSHSPNPVGDSSFMGRPLMAACARLGMGRTGHHPLLSKLTYPS